MNVRLPLSVLLPIVFSVSACEEGTKKPVAKVEPVKAKPAEAKPAEAKPAEKAADKTVAEIMKFGATLCTKVEGDTCTDPTKKFTSDVAMLHLVLVTPEVPRKTGKYKVDWIAEDVGKVAPPNYTIDSVEGVLEGFVMKKIATHVTVKGQLSKPTKGWPIGKYRVETRIEGKLVSTEKFEIAAAPAK